MTQTKRDDIVADMQIDLLQSKSLNQEDAKAGLHFLYAAAKLPKTIKQIL